MHICVKNIPATFNPNPIWNDGALCFFEDRCLNEKKKNDNNKMSSDHSVPGLKVISADRRRIGKFGFISG